MLAIAERMPVKDEWAKHCGNKWKHAQTSGHFLCPQVSKIWELRNLACWAVTENMEMGLQGALKKLVVRSFTPSLLSTAPSASILGPLGMLGSFIICLNSSLVTAASVI